MKSLEENEHMVRCEIQISASLKISANKKQIFSFFTKKNTQIKFQVNICTWCLAWTVYFIKCLLKARKTVKTVLALYNRIFGEIFSLGKVSVAPKKMILTDYAQRDRGMTTVTQIRMTLFLVWILLVAPGINLPMELMGNVKIIL